MLNKKAYPTVNKSTQILKKKLCVFFIFICMLVNGFAFSTVEIGRHSLFMITIAATQNVMSAVISKCNDSLVKIANKAYKHIKTLLFNEVGAERMPAGMGEERNGESGSETNGIMPASSMNMKREMANESEKWALGFTYSEIIFNNEYCGDKIGKGGNFGCLLMLFLIFIAAIRQRKGLAQENILKINRIRKMRISA
ncbi:MAG: hypothetical protein LBL00_08420 [Endomicrobium sp.]|jgi:hypothetical protein|nr:hypothetical protein [Endomicrobium sp.]